MPDDHDASPVGIVACPHCAQLTAVVGEKTQQLMAERKTVRELRDKVSILETELWITRCRLNEAKKAMP